MQPEEVLSILVLMPTRTHEKGPRMSLSREECRLEFEPGETGAETTQAKEFVDAG